MSAAPAHRITRREALALLGAAAAGLTAACSPAQMLQRLNSLPHDTDAVRIERNLRAFALTIVPAASPDDPVLARPFYDPDFPMAQYRDLFATDLARRARARTGRTELDRLSLQERVAIVREGMHGDHVSRRLYTAAAFMVQVALFGGLYAGSSAVPLVRFEGEYRFRGLHAITYPEPERYLARPASIDGNPA